MLYTGHTDKVFAIAWSPVQDHIIASGGRDKTVQVWNGLTGESSYIYSGHHACVLSLAWSPDGAYLASGDTEGIVAIWDAHTGEMLHNYHGHVRFVRAIAWSPDGHYIASGGDYGDSTVQVWEPFTGRRIHMYNEQYRIFAVSWSPKNSLLASGSFDGTVHIWDAFTGETALIYRGHTGPVYAVAWSPNGLSQGGFWENQQREAREVGARGGGLQGGGLALAPLDPFSGGGKHPPPSKTSPRPGQARGPLAPTSYASRRPISKSLPMKAPNGPLLASAGQDTTVQLWDANTGSTLCTYRGHTQPVKALSWSPDGKYVVSGSDDMTVQVWHAMTEERVSVYEGHHSWVRAVAWSQDGEYVASASDTSVHVIPVAVVRGL